MSAESGTFKLQSSVPINGWEVGMIVEMSGGISAKLLAIEWSAESGSWDYEFSPEPKHVDYVE